MNPREEKPDSPPADKPPVAPVILEYAGPPALVRRENFWLAALVGLHFGAMVFIYTAILLAIMACLDSGPGSVDVVFVVKFTLFGSLLAAIYAGGTALIVSLIRAGCSGMQLENRKIVSWFGPAVYLGVWAVIHDLPFTIRGVGDFVLAWILFFPMACGWFLLRPADLSKGPNP